VGFVALITWFVTALGGLYMLAVWLIENDVTGRGTSASRLPLPVILGHVFLAVSGLIVWVAYLLLDRDVLAWAAFYILLGIASLGFTMFARWIPVYRGPALTAVHVGPLGSGQLVQEMPPEGNFPVVVVIAHGLLAVSTLTLVLLTALGVGSS
jgi:hypothetical protein